MKKSRAHCGVSILVAVLISCASTKTLKEDESYQQFATSELDASPKPLIIPGDQEEFIALRNDPRSHAMTSKPCGDGLGSTGNMIMQMKADAKRLKEMKEVVKREIMGLWRSDRALTIARAMELGIFDEKQMKLLSSEDLFGHMVYFFRKEDVMIIFGGECSPFETYEIRDASNGSLTIVFSNSSEMDSTTDLLFKDGNMQVPVNPITGFSEIFSRVTYEEVLKDNPCIAEVDRS